jgi:hypothetical protein
MDVIGAILMPLRLHLTGHRANRQLSPRMAHLAEDLCRQNQYTTDDHEIRWACHCRPLLNYHSPWHGIYTIVLRIERL